MISLLWLACSGDDTVPAPVSDSATPPPQACAVDPDNTLRVRCVFDRLEGGPLELGLTGPDGVERVYPGSDGALAGSIVGYDLLADTDYAWALRDGDALLGSGVVTLPALPEDHALVFTPLVDGPTAVERMLFGLTCGAGPTLYVTDGEGRVRWYQPVDGATYVSGFEWTDRGTILSLDSRVRATEWSPAGEVLGRWEHPKSLPRVPHHTLTGRLGRTFVLDVQTVPYPDGRTYLVDGLTELLDGDAVHRWDVAEALDPTGLPAVAGTYWQAQFPGGVDFGHANAVEVRDDGGFLVTFKHLDTVLALNPDLTVRWFLPGAPSPAQWDGLALARTSPSGLDVAFERPHHANTTPWGDLLLFDNGDFGAPSRVTQWQLDEEGLVATLVADWELGASCPIQSSAYGLPDGSVLAACASTKELYELDATGIRRHVQVACGSGPGSSFVRAQPISAEW